MLVFLLVGGIAACRPGPADAPAPSGRTWPTPPLESASESLIAQRLPRVVYRGGPFLRNPRIVTLTFAGDDPALTSRLEQFANTVTRSAWWREVVDSYCAEPDDCIGEGQPGMHVRLDEALPAQVRDVDVAAIVKREAEAGRLGSLDVNTLLLVYLPPGVQLSDAFTPRYCGGGPRAVHRALRLDGATVPYSILPRCSDEAELTATASHEILEATTNPDPMSRGFAFVPDANALAFTASGVEPVDPCGLITMDGHWTHANGFVVQRAWSNRAASLGRDPCVPTRAARPFVALVPREPVVRLTEEGQTATVALDAAADGEVPAWAASAFDLTGYQDRKRYVDLSLEPPTIAVGQTARLTITLRARNARKRSEVGIVSTLGVHSYLWPLTVIMD